MTDAVPLPQLPGHWDAVEMKWLLRFNNGCDYKDVESEDGEYPVYGSGGAFALATEYLHDGESVLFGRKGTIDRPLHVNERFWTVDTMYYTSIGPSLCGRFLYYYATTIPYGLLSTSTALPSMTQSTLGTVKVPLPPLEEQRAIAEFLDRETAQIDAMIDAQQRLVELLAERRSALADRLALGTLSEGAGGPSRELDLLGTHLAVAPALATIPATWNVVRFKAALQRLEERNIGAQHIMMSLKSTGEVVERSSLGDRQEPDPESVPRYLVAHPGDLVVNPMWLTGGAIGVSQVTGAVSPDYRVFRTRGEHDPRYLHHLLRTRPYFDQYQLYTRAQTTFDRRVQQDDLDSLPLPVPPMSEQREIARRIDEHSGRFDQLIFESRRSIDLLRERRAALITAAVTGVLDPRTGVEHLDVILEEVGV